MQPYGYMKIAFRLHLEGRPQAWTGEEREESSPDGPNTSTKIYFEGLGETN
jgi:hypothetical protein